MFCQNILKRFSNFLLVFGRAAFRSKHPSIESVDPSLQKVNFEDKQKMQVAILKGTGSQTRRKSHNCEHCDHCHRKSSNGSLLGEAGGDRSNGKLFFLETRKNPPKSSKTRRRSKNPRYRIQLKKR